MSFAYKQAASVIQDFWNKKASLKTLVYDSSFEKKGYLFALCNKTLLASPLLDELMKNCKTLASQKINNKALFYVTLYDEIFGEGCRGGGAIIRVVRECKADVLNYLEKRRKEENVESIKDLVRKESAAEKWRFLRVNRCKTTVDKVIRILSEELGEENVQRDDFIDCILRIPHAVDLHKHPLVLSQSIILQTKASCFPPYLLLRDLYDGTKQLPKRCDVIDATAAPGNKTTFLGDILRKQGTVYAFDRDDRRFSLLRSRCKEYGSQNIHCIHADFLKTNPYSAEFQHVQRIQLDPSCSGSGMSHTALDAVQPTPERLQALTRFQLQCILHAARFPHVERISYSTCSIYEEEDECVVAEALRQLNETSSSWRVQQIGRELHQEGHVVEGLTEDQAAGVVRCEIGDGVGQGFFVCVFERDSVMKMSDQERKKKEAEFKKELESGFGGSQHMEGGASEQSSKPAPTQQKRVIVPKMKNGMGKGANASSGMNNSSDKKDKKDKVVVDYAAKAKLGRMGKKGKKVPLGRGF